MPTPQLISTSTPTATPGVSPTDAGTLSAPSTFSATPSPSPTAPISVRSAALVEGDLGAGEVVGFVDEVAELAFEGEGFGSQRAGGGEGAGPCFLGPVPGNGGLAGLVWWTIRLVIPGDRTPMSTKP